MVQQQAIRDHDQALSNFFAGTHGYPSWRKAGRQEGFSVVSVKPGHVRRLSRNVGEIRIPKAGCVHFRWSRAVPADVKSIRVTLDRVGRWHVSFQVPQSAVARTQTGRVIGIDCGVKVTLVTSEGQHYRAPGTGSKDDRRRIELQRRLNRQEKGSARRRRTVRALRVMDAKSADRRRDWAEKISTRLVRDYDVIAYENLNIRALVKKPAPKPDPDREGTFLPNGHTQRAALSQGIHASVWGTTSRRTEQKATASGCQVVFVNPRFTSQQCHACGHIASSNRESQAVFRCISCGHTDHADANAAKNILARGLAIIDGKSPAQARGHTGARLHKTAQAAAGTFRGAA
jgi:transposase